MTDAPTLSIVRENLLKVRGYTPYCGADKCAWHWPRTRFNGSQFACGCGWVSSFEPEFIAQYKASKQFCCSHCGQSDNECDGYSCTEAAHKASRP